MKKLHSVALAAMSALTCASAVAAPVHTRHYYGQDDAAGTKGMASINGLAAEGHQGGYVPGADTKIGDGLQQQAADNGLQQVEGSSAKVATVGDAGRIEAQQLS